MANTTSPEGPPLRVYLYTHDALRLSMHAAQRVLRPVEAYKVHLMVMRMMRVTTITK